jgi:hypothetical protein
MSPPPLIPVPRQGGSSTEVSGRRAPKIPASRLRSPVNYRRYSCVVSDTTSCEQSHRPKRSHPRSAQAPRPRDRLAAAFAVRFTRTVEIAAMELRRNEKQTSGHRPPRRAEADRSCRMGLSCRRRPKPPERLVRVAITDQSGRPDRRRCRADDGDIGRRAPARF